MREHRPGTLRCFTTTEDELRPLTARVCKREPDAGATHAIHHGVEQLLLGGFPILKTAYKPYGRAKGGARKVGHQLGVDYAVAVVHPLRLRG